MAIQILDAHTAELIAAGEVVERPASVVKELAENAIDAGATTVAIAITRGGVESIVIEDNGCGMEKADIPLAFVRHATSKVRTIEDLDAIATLGFRGEALASIASVAKMEVLTKHENEDSAWRYTVEGGVEGPLLPAARAAGTTIAVRNLFYNVPARMKFLKKDASEGTFVGEVAMRLALSHPQVAFRFVRDEKQVFATPGDGKLESAVYTVLGAAFARGLLPVDAADGNYRVTGFVTPPRAGRASRAMQYFFINGRHVKNRTMMAALEQAYRGMAMQGRFPGGVLFLHMPYGLVDVNVHPAKTEVRFAREQEVFGAVYRAVKAALVQGAGQYGRFAFGAGEGVEDAAGPAGEESPAAQPGQQAHGTPAQSTTQTTMGGMPHRETPAPQQLAAWQSTVESAAQMAGALSSDAGYLPYTTAATAVRQPPPAGPAPGEHMPVWPTGLDIDPEEDEDAAAQQQQLPGTAGGAELRLVGEVFKTYILAQMGDSLCLIDKHAAHERNLYEKLAAQRDGAASQQLLSPVNVQLSAEEKEALLQNGEVLRAAGLEVEDFGGGSVLVRGVPADVENSDVEGLVVELAARLSVNPKDSIDAKTQWVLHSMACRAAVKAGDNTPPGALLALAQDILTGKVPPFCPHGRPVVLEIPRKELEKQFGRLG
ncbi:DNA mismatch repair endonuclease MutL [Ruminococcaceae bacterium OttesenSCG-928-O06]|nr:DNA mismatch repair endonuclease MutL [Ruminococcaceae bacterium OttesenSCG-928-O06]